MIEAAVLAVALAMDATAVATARSVSGASRTELLMLAASFGIFQAGMAGLGLLVGRSAADFIATWDHWLTFGLLSVIGGKMLWEAFHASDEHEHAAKPKLDARTIIMLSVATSIDALAAGVSLPTLDAPPLLALGMIGAASFALSTIGALAGSALGKHHGRRLEAVGGVALIAIGLKTLLEHLQS